VQLSLKKNYEISRNRCRNGWITPFFLIANGKVSASATVEHTPLLLPKLVGQTGRARVVASFGGSDSANWEKENVKSQTKSTEVGLSGQMHGAVLTHSIKFCAVNNLVRPANWKAAVDQKKSARKNSSNKQSAYQILLWLKCSGCAKRTGGFGIKFEPFFCQKITCVFAWPTTRRQSIGRFETLMLDIAETASGRADWWRSEWTKVFCQRFTNQQRKLLERFQQMRFWNRFNCRNAGRGGSERQRRRSNRNGHRARRRGQRPSALQRA